MQLDLLQTPIGYRPPEDIRILVGCEKSGTARRRFQKLGFDVFSCDLQQSDDRSNRHYTDDVRNVLAMESWDFLYIAHPPCTRTCLSGVRWLTGPNPPKGKTFDDMWRELEEGCELFSDCWTADVPHIAIENPQIHRYAVERIRNYVPPAQTIHPYYYGCPFFKKTSWWLKNLPCIKDTNRLTPPKPGTEEHKAWSMIHRTPPSPERSNIRSKTFPGHADAFTTQWGQYICNYAIEPQR